MGLALGIDPGNTGAFVISDGKNVLWWKDMPIWHMQVGKSKKRPRIDAVKVAEYVDFAYAIGVEVAVLEAVGGRPRQGASPAFVFGYGVGLIYMALIKTQIVVETATPTTWKKMMRVPGKSGDDDAILQRTDELFPHDRLLFRGPHGGPKLDRAEAALLSKYGTDFVLSGRSSEGTGQELALIYRNADTGA